MNGNRLTSLCWVSATLPQCGFTLLTLYFIELNALRERTEIQIDLEFSL